MNDRYSDKKNDRDDADARGEHQYGDEPAPREESRPDPLERKPGHYAAGANGTHDVSGPAVPPTSATDAGVPSPGEDQQDRRNRSHEDDEERIRGRRSTEIDEKH
jgi:hypothetical protein